MTSCVNTTIRSMAGKSKKGSLKAALRVGTKRSNYLQAIRVRSAKSRTWSRWVTTCSTPMERARQHSIQAVVGCWIMAIGPIRPLGSSLEGPRRIIRHRRSWILAWMATRCRLMLGVRVRLMCRLRRVEMIGTKRRTTRELAAHKKEESDLRPVARTFVIRLWLRSIKMMKLVKFKHQLLMVQATEKQSRISTLRITPDVMMKKDQPKITSLTIHETS